MIARMLLGLGLVLGMSFPAIASESSRASLKVGDPIEKVHETLGKPHGFAQIGEKRFFYFDRGRVVANGNEVIELDLMTNQQLARREELRAQEAERARDALEQQQKKAETRLIQAEARLTEAKALSTEYQAHPRVIVIDTPPRLTYPSPALSPNPVARYRDIIRARRLDKAFPYPRYYRDFHRPYYFNRCW